MAETSRIAVIGSINVDLVTYLRRLPAPGETVAAEGFERHHGGKGANQAVAAARLGSRVLMVGRVGEDVFGADALANLQAEGIDTRHVCGAPGAPTGIATILVDPAGENRIMIVAGANGELRPEDIDAAEADLAGCDLILLQLEVPLETVYRAAALAAGHGRAVILNPAPAAAALDLARLGNVAFLAPNRTELAQLTGRPAQTAAQAEAAARTLAAATGAAVIVTMGEQGALLVGPDSSLHIPAVPVAAVDTTGAGDACIGAFAHFYAGSRDAPSALSAAARYAALSITRRGAQSSFPSLAEFQAFRRAV